MSRRSAIPAVLVAAALAGGCAEDARDTDADRPADQLGSPSAEKAPYAAGTVAREEAGGRAKAGAGEKAAGSRKKSRDENEPSAAKQRSGRKPTARQIQAAIRNQGEQQVDDLPPRLRRLRDIGIAQRQGTPQKQRQLSPEEQRAFDTGIQSPEYQNYP